MLLLTLLATILVDRGLAKIVECLFCFKDFWIISGLRINFSLNLGGFIRLVVLTFWFPVRVVRDV